MEKIQHNQFSVVTLSPTRLSILYNRVSDMCKEEKNHIRSTLKNSFDLNEVRLQHIDVYFNSSDRALYMWKDGTIEYNSYQIKIGKLKSMCKEDILKLDKLFFEMWSSYKEIICLLYKIIKEDRSLEIKP